ncbi:MAG: hypothetical protein HWE15_03090 [Algoriphagus sp.]|uniref:hypothetical protein n=1 Tax=Algoriphagus sp. TaxID=1872435 RepID=UPI001811B7C4|nr:hypothetical protein [Algoriphagus sp.]NVJ85259.1 hypothetical protein [Algoriphagus sp.]
MIIQIRSAKFLISNPGESIGTLLVKSDNEFEIKRLFGSEKILKSKLQEWPYEVRVCKQEFLNGLILLVKEIDYQDFRELSDLL